MKAIRPCCENTTTSTAGATSVILPLSKHPFSLFVKVIQIKPMQSLSNDDEINAIISKSGPFSRKYFISNVVSRLCVFNLLLAHITGYYLLKVLRKEYCRLAIASCTIPCQISILY